MKLASQEAMADRETGASRRNSWIENEPTLTEDSANVFDELCNATKEGMIPKCFCSCSRAHSCSMYRRLGKNRKSCA